MKTHHKSSKRKKLSLKYNIQKRVREHKRRVKKEAKRMGIKKRTRRDPGIPNTWPFKAEMLDELEKQKDAREADLAMRRVKAKKIVQKEKALHTEEKKKREADRDTDRREKRAATLDQSQRETTSRILSRAEVFLVALDVKDPSACRCMEFEKWATENSKPVLFVLTKSDSAPPQLAAQWIKILAPEAPVIAVAAEAGRDGIAGLMQLLGHGPGAQGDGKTVGVVGYPGTGKKALCKALRQENKAPAKWLLEGSAKLKSASAWTDPLANLRMMVRGVLPAHGPTPKKEDAAAAAASGPVGVVNQLLANVPPANVVRRLRLPGFEGGSEALLRTYAKDRKAKTNKGKEPTLEALSRMLLSEVSNAPACYVAPPAAPSAAQSALWAAYASRRQIIEATLATQANELAARPAPAGAAHLVINALAGVGPTVDIAKLLEDVSDDDGPDGDADMDDSDDEESGSFLEGEESEEEDMDE